VLKNKGERAPQVEVMGALRKELNQIPGLRAVVMDLSQQGFTAQRGFPIEFSVRGGNWEKLIETSGAVRQKLARSGTVVDLDTDYRLGMPELRVEPDRARVADLGLSVQEVAQAVNLLVGGQRIGKFNSDGRRVDVRVRLLADQRSRPESLGHLKLQTPRGEVVPLSALIKLEERPAAQSITRRERERAISIFGNVAAGSSQDKALAAVESLSQSMPEGTRLVLSGSSVAFKESMQSLLFALVLGIIVAYMVLAAQFNSFRDPFVVLAGSVPLALFGALIFTFLKFSGPPGLDFPLTQGWTTTLNIYSQVGLVTLIGLIAKNGILIVQFANSEQLRGANKLDAVRAAAVTRLRPILMTTIATVCGHFPLTLVTGPGAIARNSIGIVLVGGMALGTVFILFVVPSLYVLIAKEHQTGELDRGEPEPDPAGIPAGVHA
jgi:multidrug efflux pump subunit AcrB